MAKFALKFLLATSILGHRNRRTDWAWRLTVFGTLLTVVLVGLYLFQRGATP
jgi:hypothetical protein